MLVVFLLSGLYPAFVLSSFAPVKVLKGKFSNSASGTRLRRYLVIGQFAITIVLITGSLVVYRQINFMSSRPLGYDIDQVLILRRPVLTDRRIPFMNTARNFIAEVQRLPQVKGASMSGRIPGEELGRQRDVYRTDTAGANKITVTNMGIDQHFLELYNMRLLAGRNFAARDYHDSAAKLNTLLVNASASRQLGFATPGESIGKPVKVFNRDWTIIGVVNDFHQKSLKYAMEPMVLMPSLQGRYSTFSLKVDTRNLAETVSQIGALYYRFFPGNLFDHYFLDKKFNSQYSDDRFFGKIFWIFAALAIVIACLGLLGLALVSTTQRAQEIGVRKVLGASVGDIVVLVSVNLVKPILIAAAISSPIAWWLMNSWLQDFAYRINLSPWLFVIAGLMVLIIALLTVSFQTIRTAVANPVKSLRN
jgi:putative ABC transport system permease protein